MNVAHLQYVLAAMTSWSPTVKVVTLEPIVEDIVEVAPVVDPAYQDDDDRLKTELLVAAIGKEESGWASWVGDGRCNREWWRRTHADLLQRYGGDCDGGKSWTYWQLELERGDPSGPKLLADRKLAITLVIERAKRSMDAGHGLCDYVGDVYPHCPRADRRLRLVSNWMKDHPFSEAVATVD